jgi:hypothetical protein
MDGVAGRPDKGPSAATSYNGGFQAGLAFEVTEFGVATTDPTTHTSYPGSNSANFWVDVQVSDTAPSGASYRLWPALPQPLGWFRDSALNFTIATDVKLSQSGPLDRPEPGRRDRPRAGFAQPGPVVRLPGHLGHGRRPGILGRS